MRPARSLLLWAALVGSGCVIPDRDLQINDEKVTNKHPVRFVEPTPLTVEAAELCLAMFDDDKDEKTAVCQPSEPDTVLPHFLDPGFTDAEGNPEPYNFCTCSPDKEDRLRLPATTLFVEDRKNDPEEDVTLYAALQLDLDPAELEPHRMVAYTAYVNPGVTLTEPPPTQLNYRPPRRQNTYRELRELYLGQSEERMDLCNGNGQPLRRGFHTLRVIVTDTEWFSEDGDPRWGVPDLANGATYDTMTYIFYCDDATNVADPHCETQCQQRETL